MASDPKAEAALALHRFGLGPLGPYVDKVQQGGQRKAMRASLANLAELLRSEG